MDLGQSGSKAKMLVIIMVTLVLRSTAAMADVVDDFFAEAERGRLAVFEYYLEKAPDVNAKNKDGETALIIALSCGHYDIVQALLTKGVDVNAKNKHGETAFLLASKAGQYEIVQAILAKGADVNTPSQGGFTALMMASQAVSMTRRPILFNASNLKPVTKNELTSSGILGVSMSLEGQFIDIVRALLAKGADVNAKNEDGKTALMFSIRWAQLEIVQTLLDNGADINSKDNKGQTALSMAERPDVRELLIKAGAQQ